jgi:hypothetical protein
MLCMMNQLLRARASASSDKSQLARAGFGWGNFYLAHLAREKQNALFDPSYVNQIRSFRSAEATLMLLCILVTL